MTEFLRWLTLTHSQRLHAHRHTTGWGHVYQGRFKSFPIEQDEALLIELPRDWVGRVNRAQSAAELERYAVRLRRLADADGEEAPPGI